MKVILSIILIFLSFQSFAKVEIWDCPYRDGSGKDTYKISYEERKVFKRLFKDMTWWDMSNKGGVHLDEMNFIKEALQEMKLFC